MKFSPLIIVVFLFFVENLSAQQTENYFKLFNIERTELEKLTQIISIDNYTEKTITAYATDIEMKQLLAAGYTPVFQNKKKTIEVGQMAGSVEELTPWNFYPTYEQYVALMQQFATNYPALCKLDTLGYSNQNRLILALRISDNVSWKEPEPKVLYSSTMHGDEVVGYVLMLRFAEYLLSNYEVLPEISELVKNLQIYIVPLINPDGTYYGGNNNVFGSRRNNNPGGNDLYGYDINRNYPDFIKGTNPNGPTQKETKIMMDFFAKHRFGLSANFHGGIEVVNYPWDNLYRRNPDDAWLQKTARMYADTAQKHSYVGYFNDLNNGITNGYDWYPVYGGQQDYQNQFRGGREVTIEISTNKTPSAVTLPDFWEYNYRSFINYLQHALYGIQGIITDSETGKPLEAKVFIPNLDADNSHVYSDAETGLFLRMQNAGFYNLEISAKGYVTQVLENIEINDKKVTKLSVQLKPDKTAFENETKRDTNFEVINLANKTFAIKNISPIQNEMHIEIFDLSGKSLLKHRTELNEYIPETTNFASGIYILQVGNKAYKQYFKILIN